MFVPAGQQDASAVDGKPINIDKDEEQYRTQASKAVDALFMARLLYWTLEKNLHNVIV